MFCSIATFKINWEITYSKIVRQSRLTVTGERHITDPSNESNMNATAQGQ